MTMNCCYLARCAYLFFGVFCIFALNTNDFARSQDVTSLQVLNNHSDQNIAAVYDRAPSYGTQVNVNPFNIPAVLRGIRATVQRSWRRFVEALFRLLFLNINTNIEQYIDFNNTMTISDDISVNEALPEDRSSPNNAKATTELSWSGKPASESERKAIAELRAMIKSYSDAKSQWLQRGVEDVELLRFLRAKHDNVQQAWKMIAAHDRWRISQYGAESSFLKVGFDNSPLLQEIFWLGVNKQGCPTLVIRTQLHDGYYYNDDPKIYTRYGSLLILGSGSGTHPTAATQARHGLACVAAASLCVTDNG